MAAGFCPLALGSQTVGSVIRPAANCGIVGFKPTYGRLPVGGVIPFSPAMDQLGLFAQDAAGMELTASTLVPDWDEDPGPEPSAERPVLGVPEGPYLAQASDEARALFEGQVSRLVERGYAVRRVLTLQDIDAVNGRHRRIIAAEAAAVHADWFARHERLYRPRTAALLREGQTVIASELEADRAQHPLFAEAQAEVMRAAEVDLWITPAATGPAPEGLASTGDPAMSLPWTQAGMPAVTIPAGRATNGLPVGLQCVAPRMRDRSLLRWAVELEQALEAS